MTYQHAILAAAAALSFNAQATSTDWGAHDPLEIAATMTSTGAFSDTYLFSLASFHSVFNTTVANNLTGVLGISNGMLELFRETGVVDTSVGGFAFNGSTGNISHGFGALAGGDYYYQVTGIGTGTMGGFYSVSSTVTAVPEPETYVLMLGGLAAVGFMALRRRQG